MAADQYVCGSGPIILPAAKLCALAISTPASRRITYNAIRINWSAASSINVLCHLSRITNTPSGSAIPANYGPNPHDPAAPASLMTAACASTANPGVWTTAPTEGAILWESYLSSTGGPWTEIPVPGEEWDQAVSTWVGLFFTAAATGVTVYPQLIWTE